MTLIADASTEGQAALSALAPVATGTVGLLVGRVSFVSEGGRREIGLGGRVVEVTANGIVPSERRYFGTMGLERFEVPADHVVADVEVE